MLVVTHKILPNISMFAAKINQPAIQHPTWKHLLSLGSYTGNGI
jgi:hypothetical protein